MRSPNAPVLTKNAQVSERRAERLVERFGRLARRCLREVRPSSPPACGIGEQREEDPQPRHLFGQLLRLRGTVPARHAEQHAEARPDLSDGLTAHRHARLRDSLHHGLHFCLGNDDTSEVEAAHLPWQHLGSLLINRGLLTVDQVKQAFEEQQLTGKRLGEIVVGHNWVAPQDLAKALAEQICLEYADLSETDLDMEAAMLLPKELAARYQAVPVRFLSEDLLLVAVADPSDVGRADDLRLALGHNVRLAVSEPADLERTIKKLYRPQI